MSLRIIATYVGPNRCLPVRAVRARLDATALMDWRSGSSALDFLAPILKLIPSLRPRLDSALPSASAELIGGAEDGAIGIADVIMHTAMELQALIGYPLGTATVLRQANPVHFDIVCEMKNPELATRALRQAASAVIDLLPSDRKKKFGFPENFDTAQAIQGFLARNANRGLDLTVAAITEAAEARDIPWSRLHRASRIIQLGQGRYQQRIREDLTGREGFLAANISADKALTHHLLESTGGPVAEQAIAADSEGAVKEANRIGYPVVLKPIDRGKGKGVFVGLAKDRDVTRAFNEIRKLGSRAIVEKFVDGEDHRLLVIGGKLVAAARRIPGGVTGDGKSTVRELIDVVNGDPRRGVGFSNVRVRLELDAVAYELLTAAGLTADSVPKDGERVILRRTANISTGGNAIDVTDDIHPDNRRMAVLAAATVGVEIAGVDFITSDISRSYLDAGGAVTEVNISPGLRPHWIEDGDDRDCVGPILDLMFPSGSPSRIPVAAVTGTNGKTTTSHMLAHILSAAGIITGCASTIGVSVGGETIQTKEMSGPGGARMILHNPTAEAAVIEVARGALIRMGLGVDRCDVACVTNITTDHLGEFGIDSHEEMAGIKRIVADAATDTVVLNADDPLCLAMKEGRRAEHACLVSLDEENAEVTAHIKAGGRAALLEQKWRGTELTLYDGGRRTTIMKASEIPASFGGAARHNLQNALFAAAMAYGLGHDVEMIRAGLTSFTCDHASLPYRANLYDGHPFKVILDYAHNPGAFEAIGRTVDSLADGGQRIGVFTSPGNRDDKHLREIARAAAPHFDRFVCRTGILFDRGPREVPDKLREALIELGIEDDRITVIPDPDEAVQTGLKMAAPGDILFVMAIPIPENRFWERIVNFGNRS